MFNRGFVLNGTRFFTILTVTLSVCIVQINPTPAIGSMKYKFTRFYFSSSALGQSYDWCSVLDATLKGIGDIATTVVVRYKYVSIGKPVVDIRPSHDRLISTTGFPILVRWHFYIESYQYRKSHYRHKTLLRPFYLHNGISCADKMTSLYWIRAQYQSATSREKCIIRGMYCTR